MSHLDGLIVDVDESNESGRYRLTRDGKKAYEPKITFTERGFEWLRLGILCGNCFEDLRPVGAFPERCPLCGFQVRELQMSQLERDFVGREQLGSRLSLSDELERLGELWTPEE